MHEDYEPVIDAKPYDRIVYAIGDSTTVAWSNDANVLKDGELVFTDVATGKQKYVSESCAYAVTQEDELPPAVRENAIQAGMMEE